MRSSVQPRGVEEQRVRLRAYWLDSETVAIDWYGYVSAADCELALLEMRRLVGERTPRRFFSDTSQSTGFANDIRRPVSDIMALVRDTGVQEMFAVFESSPIRMLAAATGFVNGIRVKEFAGRAEALAHFPEPGWEPG